MSNPTGQAPNPAADPQTPAPTAGADAPPGPAPEPERFDAEYVRRLRSEAADYRTRLRALEEKAKADDDAKLNELERAKKRATDLEQQLAKLAADRKANALRYSVAQAAGKLGIVDADAAMRLLDAEALTYNDAGDPTNVDDALRALAKARPWLVTQAQATTSAANPARGSKGALTREQIASMTPDEINARWDEVQAVMAGSR